MSSRRESNRARLEATLQWLGETIGDNVEGYHTEMLVADVGKLRFIRDGAVYQCDIVLRAVRIQGPAPEPDPEPVLETAREITLRRDEAIALEPEQSEIRFTVGLACDHGIERGRFCRACDEEQ